MKGSGSEAGERSEDEEKRQGEEKGAMHWGGNEGRTERFAPGGLRRKKIADDAFL